MLSVPKVRLVEPRQGQAMTETLPMPTRRKSCGRIYIDWNRCKGCGFCIEFCPPKVLAFAPSYNAHGYHPPQLIKEDGCTGCDLCGLYCPDFAIFGVREPVAARPGKESASES
jgi:2-oxoglutarate ferredoxin oxidoreductase subunit delta